ncbi:MAG: conjugal transfer protein TrbH, partial [Pseudorhodoplanes sp.]
MITRRVFPVGLFALLLGACSTLGRPGLVASSSRVELSPAAASAIAGDMVSRLAEHVGPATGTIILKSDGSPFGQALEAALRGWGYAVATDQRTDQKAIALAYVVDNLDGTILA